MQTRKVNGATVKALREALGISLRGMARDIRLDSSNLSRLERGNQQCSPATMVAIAKRLGVGVDAISYCTEDAA